MNTHTVTIRSLASIVIPVTDQDVALAFYRDKLGLGLRANFELGPDVRWIEVAPSGSGTTLALAAPRGGMWRNVGGVDADEHGLELPGVPPMFRLRDPFANILQVVQTR
jgi:catechol 2,3-dioxygenase-like lactoylglutathione lyase family enzyme